MSKHKDHKALVGRVKKAVKKTRRKLSEDQFEKELQRTISFLADLKDHIGELQAKATAQQAKPAAAKVAAKPAKPTKPKAAQAKTVAPAASAAQKPAKK
jgi:hypothetical protein